MGLFKKMRDILFDEEEYTEQIKITPEMRNEETPAKEEKVIEKKEEKVEQTKPVEEKTQPVSERELFKTDSKFPFFDFDEEEFASQNPPASKPQTQQPAVPKRQNVFDYERRKKIEKRTDYGRFERTEITETTERKKFKPSPIISPVYGILDRNYVKSDIMQRSDLDKVDIQAVRNKAFGEKKEVPKVEPKTVFYEETETVTLSEPEEKQKKVKTIDELLEDTADLVVDIDRDLDTEMEDIVLPKEISKTSVKEQSDVKESKSSNVEDTLENDLFDLIDSMYDNKEDGE